MCEVRVNLYWRFLLKYVEHIKLWFKPEKKYHAVHMKICVKIMVRRPIISGFKDVAEEIGREKHNGNFMPNTLFRAVVQFRRYLQEMGKSRVATNSCVTKCNTVKPA